MPERIRVVQVELEGYDHLRAFDEVAHSLASGLVDLGHDADRAAVVDPGARNIVLGAHVLAPAELARLPDRTVVYNHEQIESGSLLPPDRLAQYRRFELWDYSRKNVQAWAAQGIEARHVPIGWSPDLERIDRTGPQPIDVLFYGSLNERRERVLRSLADRGLRVEAPFGVYGDDRDALIARSKLVVNVQFYEAGILEIVRLSYLFANAVPVVSEIRPGMEVPSGLEDAAAFAPYDRLVETVRGLVGDPDALVALGARARERMRAQPWSRSLAGVLPPAAGSAVRTGSVVGRASDRATVELVCGPPGPTLAAGGAPGGPVTEVVDDVLALAGTRRHTLGAPPPFDWRADPRLAEVRDRLLDRLADGCPERVVDPSLALVLPFVVEALQARGCDVRVTLVLDRPEEAAEYLAASEGLSPIRGILVWLSHALFGDAFSRDLDRRVVGSGALDGGPGPGFRAAEVAHAVRAALVADPPDLDTVDDHAGRYLDAMELYFPLLDEL